MTFPMMECLAGHMGLDMALKKTKTQHWVTTSFMKQSIYGFCISNLLMKAFELASVFHKERSKGTHVSKCKTQPTPEVFAFLTGNKAIRLIAQI